MQIAINRIGLQSKDVIGGITTAEAGKQIGSLTIIHQAVAKGDLKGRRVGRRWVIPHADWAAWKARRSFPPDGFIPLRSLKEPLSILSDKLSEVRGNGLRSHRHSLQSLRDKRPVHAVRDLGLSTPRSPLS